MMYLGYVFAERVENPFLPLRHQPWVALFERFYVLLLVKINSLARVIFISNDVRIELLISFKIFLALSLKVGTCQQLFHLLRLLFRAKPILELSFRILLAFLLVNIGYQPVPQAFIALLAESIHVLH